MPIFPLFGFPSGVTGLYLKGDGLACQGLLKDYHPTPEAKHSVYGLFPDVVVRQGTAIFQLLGVKVIFKIFALTFSVVSLSLSSSTNASF